MRRLALFTMAVALTLAFVVPAQAQFARASIEGTVTDPDGAGLPGVTVTAVNESSGFERIAVTAANGSYFMSGMQPGMYTVTFNLQGFQSFERQNAQLLVGQTATLNATMQLGSIEETITVTAQTPLVEVTSKEVGDSVTAAEFEDLPSQNRSFVMFARLLPGVNASPSTESTASDALFVNGQDDNNNSFNVDGAANDDDVIGARAGAQTRTAIDAIQEFQVLTTQFDAEFGRTQGAVLNAVTRSGGNDFHGTAFWYTQDNGWNSRNFFTELNDAEQPDANYNSIGGTVGGPIVENVAHFFFSLERNTPNEGVSRTFATRPDLSFDTKEENLLRNWMIKGDWQMTDNHKLSIRYLREFSPQYNQIIGGQDTLERAREENDHDQNVIGSVDSVISDRSFNNLRVSWTQEDVWFANPCYTASDPTFETQRACAVSENHPSWDGGINTTAQGRVNNSYQFDDTFSIYVPDWKGDHDMRTGLNYSRRNADSGFNDTANGSFVFDSDADFDFNTMATYPLNFQVRLFGAGGGFSEMDSLGLFYQDDWQPIENLTLNLGLRYDWESIVEDGNNIAPRLGFAWDPIGEGRTVIRGGWGRFYERFGLGPYSNFTNDAIAITQGQFGRIPDTGDNRMFFWEYAHLYNLTTLNAMRDALAAMLESSTATEINRNPTVDNASRRSAYADTISAGVEHEIVEGVSFAFDYIHTKNKSIVTWGDLNPYSSSMGGRPGISIWNGEVQPSLQSIGTYYNDGYMGYNSLQFQLKRRMADSPIGRFSGRIAYTYGSQSGNNTNAQTSSSRFQFRTESGFNFDQYVELGEMIDFGLDNPANIDRSSPWFRKHILALSWTWQVPKTSWRDNGGLMLNGIWEWRSADFYTVLLRDYYDNNQRQVAPAGTYDAGTNVDYALGSVVFPGVENGAEANPFSRLDLSFRYRIPFADRYDFTILAEWFNIANRVNMASVGSTYATDAGFRVPTSANTPRQFQLGFRFTF